jgi:hypothetical protein
MKWPTQAGNVHLLLVGAGPVTGGTPARGEVDVLLVFATERGSPPARPDSELVEELTCSNVTPRSRPAEK